MTTHGPERREVDTSASEPVARPLFAPVALLGLAVAVYAFNLYRYHAYLLDDAFISFRYAQNFVAGRGLVFNPGERVEGYTNFLLVMLAAACIRVGIAPVAATKWLCLGAALWTLYSVTRLERDVATAPPRIPMAACLLLPLQGFAYWSVCGMETMLFTALFLAALVAAVRESRHGHGHASASLFVLLALTRPEGALCFVLCSVTLAVVEYRCDRTWRHLRRYALNLVVFTTGFGVYFAWRYAYYGHVFPNTFYAKVTGGGGELISGLQYLRDWCLAFPLFGAMLLFPALRLSNSLPSVVVVERTRLALWVIIVTYSAYVVAVGGDFMVFYRFFFPVMPLCAVLLVSTLEALARRRAFLWTGGVWVVSVGLSLLTAQPYHAFVAHRTALVGEVVGRWFGNMLGSGDWIAVNPAGALPYYSGLPAIDMLGLADETIARRPVFIVTPGWAGHRRGWGEYVLDRRPRMILWYNTAGAREPYYLGDHELAEDPFFRFFYRLKTVTLPAIDSTVPPVPTERFFGFPFGVTASGEGRWPEMGISGTFDTAPVARTTLYEAPIIVNYFEREARDDSLWPLKTEWPRNVEGFVDAVSARWGAVAAGETGDPEARTQVEAQCAEARRRIEAGDFKAAGDVLADAARRNTMARSPLVYQYIANLAVLAGDLFTAIAAQKEALRLAPANPLYQSNLKRLLTLPYKEGARAQVAAGGSPGAPARGF